jgi:RNA polymerase sigma-70 factor, ECF subfamily
MSDDTFSLTELFLGSFSSAVQPRFTSLPSLEQLLQEMLDKGKRTWPTFDLPAEKFLSWLAHHLSTKEGGEKQLSYLRAADLYLVCGCLQGIPEAIVAFETNVLAKVDVVLHSILKSAETVADLKQNLLKELFIPESNNPPKIEHYTGLKELSNWVFIVAVRQAINVMHKSQKESLLSEKETLDLVSLQDNPELQYLKVLYRQELSAAFQSALASLTYKERNLLRYSYLDGLNIDQLGHIYKVHRATIARWLERVRYKLLVKTREELIENLQVAKSEFESILRLVQSQLHSSVKFMLEQEHEPEQEEE